MNSRKLTGSLCLGLLLAGQASCREKVPDDTASPAASQVSPAVAPSPAPPVTSGPAAAQAASPVGADALCTKMCERGSALHCKVDTPACREACQGSLSPPCDGELRASLTCVTAEPIAHWECSDEGLPVIRDGYCNAEQTKLMGCVQQALGDSPH